MRPRVVALSIVGLAMLALAVRSVGQTSAAFQCRPRSGEGECVWCGGIFPCQTCPDGYVRDWAGTCGAVPTPTPTATPTPTPTPQPQQPWRPLAEPEYPRTYMEAPCTVQLEDGSLVTVYDSGNIGDLFSQYNEGELVKAITWPTEGAPYRLRLFSSRDVPDGHEAHAPKITRDGDTWLIAVAATYRATWGQVYRVGLGLANGTDLEHLTLDWDWQRVEGENIFPVGWVRDGGVLWLYARRSSDAEPYPLLVRYRVEGGQVVGLERTDLGTGQQLIASICRTDFGWFALEGAYPAAPSVFEWWSADGLHWEPSGRVWFPAPYAGVWGAARITDLAGWAIGDQLVAGANNGEWADVARAWVLAWLGDEWPVQSWGFPATSKPEAAPLPKPQPPVVEWTHWGPTKSGIVVTGTCAVSPCEVCAGGRVVASGSVVGATITARVHRHDGDPDPLVIRTTGLEHASAYLRIRSDAEYAMRPLAGRVVAERR